jgi:hypothetical protein
MYICKQVTCIIGLDLESLLRGWPEEPFPEPGMRANVAPPSGAGLSGCCQDWNEDAQFRRVLRFMMIIHRYT